MSIIDPQEALFQRLSGDAAYTTLLDVHDSRVALFSDYAPYGFQIGDKPIGIISAPSQNVSDDTYTEEFRQVLLELRMYHRPQGSSYALDRAAEQARATLKTWPLGAITGGTLKDVTVTGPVTAPTEDPELEGRRLPIQLLIQET